MRDHEALRLLGVGLSDVDGELFWGCESMPLLERWLNGDTIDAEKLARWRAVVPSATRREKT